MEHVRICLFYKICWVSHALVKAHHQVHVAEGRGIVRGYRYRLDLLRADERVSGWCDRERSVAVRIAEKGTCNVAEGCKGVKGFKKGLW